MKIGIVVDGQSEMYSLPELLSRIQTGRNTILIKPLYADIQPKSTTPQIARAVKTRVAILAAKKVDKVVILLDLEDQNICPGAWASKIEAEVRKECHGCGIREFAVVIKHRSFENWIIADPDALKKLPKRFNMTEAHRRAISPDKADIVEAYKMLQSMVQGASYDKVVDATKILRHAEPSKLAENSRSFRRFMRVLGNPTYINQSAVRVSQVTMNETVPARNKTK